LEFWWGLQLDRSGKREVTGVRMGF
jgi:hypothetical protein